MKIVNINEYNENDGLKRKLRERMDAYEPELSGSVWDRIQHEMDERDANRKKRFLWWLSSVAMVVLAGSILGFLVFGGEPQNNQTVQQTTEQTQVKGGVNNTPNNGTVSGSETIITETAPINKEAYTGASNNNPVSSTSSIPTKGTQKPTNNLGGGNTTTSNSGGGTSQHNGGNATPTAPATNNGSNGTDAQKPTTTEPKKDALPPVEQGEQPSVIGENLTSDAGDSVEKNEDTGEENKSVEPILTPTPTSNEMKQRWFIGLSFGYNQTFRTVTDIQNTLLVYPQANDRNKFEQKSYSPTYGFEFGFYPVKNFFIKSGVSMYQTSEQVRYDIRKKEKLQQPSAYYGNPTDSIAIGGTTQHKNTYNYIQIPLEIGYSRQVYRGLGIMVSGGVAYNMLKNYSYYTYEPYYGNAFVPPTAAEAKLYENMYKSYYMLSGSVGLQYSIGKYWMATLGVNYRRAITNAADEKFEVEIKPYSVGVNTGLAFKF